MVAKYVLQELNTTPNNVKTKEKRFVTFFCTRLTSRCLRMSIDAVKVSIRPLSRSTNTLCISELDV